MNTKFPFFTSIQPTILLVFLCLICGCSQPLDSKIILEKSIQAHGGKKHWKSVKKIQYLKEIKLYDSLGNLEQTINQILTHEWRPSKSILEWTPNDNLEKIEQQNGKIIVFKNGDDVTASRDLAAITRIMDAALYVFWQPLKLFDEQANLTYEGTTTLLGNQSVHSVRVEYSNDPNADVWHYYFGTEDFRLKATQVKHDQRTSLIMNESVETSTGLFLNKIRKSYFMHPDGSINYLRAAYDYTVILLETAP